MRTSGLMILRDTLLSLLVFLNENCCLCTCFTETIFIVLIVSSLFHNFNRCTGCFKSNINIACSSTQNAASKHQTLLKITYNKNINKGK